MSLTKISLGFSPCPNDCFIFDAMIHGKIDTEGLSFNVVMEDVEKLNSMAFQQQLDVTKLSYHAFAYLTHVYDLLDSGSALGRNCGPLLISKRIISAGDVKKGNLKIAIPGQYTTANLLMKVLFPEAKNKVEMIFSGIEDAVQQEKVDAGLIIHENRFTYEAKGLKKIEDLGELWEQTTGLPIPLGGIVINKNFPAAMKEKVNRVLRNSIAFAFKNPRSCMDFVKANAQEMTEEVMLQHIRLYVNDFSLELGVEGHVAVDFLVKKVKENA